MSGAIKWFSVYPPGLKPEAVKFRPEHLSYMIDTLKVHCPTVDVNNFFPKAEGFRVMVIHRFDDLLLRSAQLRLQRIYGERDERYQRNEVPEQEFVGHS